MVLLFAIAACSLCKCIIIITIIHSPFRRGQAAVGRVRAARGGSREVMGGWVDGWMLDHTLPPGGGCDHSIHPPIHPPPLFCTPIIFSSLFSLILSSLVSIFLFSSKTPLFFSHTPLHPLTQSHTKCFFLKWQIFYKKLATGSITHLLVASGCHGTDPGTASDIALLVFCYCFCYCCLLLV